MSLGERIQIGWQLGTRAIGYVLRDKSLIFFPLLSWTVLLAVMLTFYVAAGPDKLRIFVNTTPNDIGVHSFNWGYYWTVFFAYLIVFYVAELCGVALTKCADKTMDGVDTQFRDGAQAASHRLLSTALWTLLASTIGIFFTLLDQERRCSRLIRNLLGAPWRVVTYFVIPVMVLEDVNIVRALRRSPQLLSQTWGERPAPHLGLGWVGLLFAGPPLMVIGGLSYFYPEWRSVLILVAIAVIVLAGLTLQTARTILMVVLYKYAAGQQVPSNFSMEFLEKAFLAGGSAAWAPPEQEDDEVDAPSGAAEAELKSDNAQENKHNTDDPNRT